MVASRAPQCWHTGESLDTAAPQLEQCKVWASMTRLRISRPTPRGKLKSTRTHQSAYLASFGFWKVAPGGGSLRIASS